MSVATEYSFAELSVAEKIDLVERLWDEIADAVVQMPVPAWQVQELARREAAQRENPNAGSSWDDVKERIIRRHG